MVARDGVRIMRFRGELFFCYRDGPRHRIWRSEGGSYEPDVRHIVVAGRFLLRADLQRRRLGRRDRPASRRRPPSRQRAADEHDAADAHGADHTTQRVARGRTSRAQAQRGGRVERSRPRRGREHGDGRSPDREARRDRRRTGPYSTTSSAERTRTRRSI
jgi:hypothetical protein